MFRRAWNRYTINRSARKMISTCWAMAIFVHQLVRRLNVCLLREPNLAARCRCVWVGGCKIFISQRLTKLEGKIDTPAKLSSAGRIIRSSNERLNELNYETNLESGRNAVSTSACGHIFWAGVVGVIFNRETNLVWLNHLGSHSDSQIIINQSLGQREREKDQVRNYSFVLSDCNLQPSEQAN